MMKYILFLIFMIPLTFLKKNFWLNLYVYGLFFMIFLGGVSFDYLVVNISYIFGYDLLSYVMVMLSIWICLLMIMASFKLYNNNNFYNLFLFLLLLLVLSLMLTFVSMNLFIFYLFFEMSLIPILIIIMGWGYQPERIQAGVYLLFYTLLASLPMMISIFYYYLNFNNLNMFFMDKTLNSFYLYLFMNMVFSLKYLFILFIYGCLSLM